MKTVILTIHENGDCSSLASDAFPFDTIGRCTKRRVSHIWPVHPVKRSVFRLLRLAFGERGRVAEWLRTWRGPWQVRFASNPGRVVYQHASRRVCIDWEISKLNGNV